MTETQAARFFLLNGPTGWRTGEGSGAESGLSAGQSGIQLLTDPAGPLSLGWPDGSLGGLLLPRGMALDGLGRLYLLEPAPPYRLLRYDPEEHVFRPVPGMGDNPPDDPRRFNTPYNLGIESGRLFIADVGSRRVLVFDQLHLTLLHELKVNQQGKIWRPLDVVAREGFAWILDASDNVVYRFESSSGQLKRLNLSRQSSARWRRIAVDRTGRLYLLRRASVDEQPRRSICDPPIPPKKAPAVLDVYDEEGRFVRTVGEPGEVRDQFEPPALRLYYSRSHINGEIDPARGFFCLPESLDRACRQELPGETPLPEAPLQLCTDPSAPGRFFDRCSEPTQMEFSELVDPPVYRTSGTWIGGPLDSRIVQCQWHRVELDLPALPPDCRIVVSTYTSSSDFSRPFPASPLWQKGYEFTGTMQPHVGSGETGGTQQNIIPTDFLVQSREGQYLWVKVELFGTGFATPVLHALRIDYPRQSYLEYLPAIYTADPESRWFLERFLSIFQTEWDGIENTLATLERYFDAAAVPAGDFLNTLAAWLGLPLEGEWSAEKSRNLLLSVREVYPRRGTLAGLRVYLQAYLQNMTDWLPAEQGDFPVLVEGFRQRQHLLLRHPSQSGKGQARRLWSPDVTGRLQLGVTSQLGHAKVISTGDPNRDLFHEYAHRFSIHVPAMWVRTAKDEAMLRRAVEREKPAHTVYELKLVEARFRIGTQSTIGLDTILGCYPVIRLTCLDRENQLAPSRQRSPILGYDTVLSRSSAQRPQPGQQLIL